MAQKVVLITGCSSGIGRALALEFHNRGYRVIATARRRESITDLESIGIATRQLDVTNSDQMEAVVGDIVEQEKTIDILVNNAGYALFGPTMEIPEDELRLQFETNVFGPLILAQKVAPVMIRNKGGLILNIGSISGVAASPFAGAYCASKSAFHVFSDVLRMELSPFGIHVVTVQPGAVASKIVESGKKKLTSLLKPDSWYKSIEESILRRAEYSQKDTIGADVFAQKLLDAILVDRPPETARIGKLSFLLPLMKRWMPTRMFENKLKKKFGLFEMRP
jgi:short-subunit dehydrogenase